MENQSGIIIYTSVDGEAKIDVQMDGETVWLSQKQMAELFQKGISTISRHITNVFEEGELREEDSTLKVTSSPG